MTSASTVTPLTRLLAYTPYLLRPALWPELGRRAARRVGLAVPLPDASLRARQRADGREWASARAVTAADALVGLGLQTGAETWLEERCSQQLNVAKAAVVACPVRMGGAGAMGLIYALCEGLEATRVIETGVAYGWSSLALLLSLANRPTGNLWSVDLPYMGRGADAYVGVAVPPQLRQRWQLLRMADREGIPRAIRAAGAALDLVHYDSDKFETGRAWAYARLWQALRRGGMLVSDDVGDNLAFANFAQRVDVQPVIVAVADKFAGVLVKP